MSTCTAREPYDKTRELSPDAAPLPLARDAEIEQVGLVGGNHHDSIAGQRIAAVSNPAFVAGGERVCEITVSPRMRVNGAFDRDDFFEMALVHPGVRNRVIELRAHRYAMRLCL